MKRKQMLTSGVILCIIYALAILASTVVMFMGVLYYFLGESIQIISDLFLPVLEIFLQNGKTLMLVIVVVMLTLSIFMLVISTKFTKYARMNAKLITNIKFLYFCFFCVFIMFGVFAYFAATTIDINNLAPIPVAHTTLAILHFVCIVLLVIGLVKISRETNIVKEVKPKEAVNVSNSSKPLIYTSDLITETKPQQPVTATKTVTTQNAEPVQKHNESESAKKLIEEIAKLDKMRKEGAITQQEYTRMRMMLIRKYADK